MKVKFIGDEPKQLSTLGIDVNPGDVIDVPDGFNNAQFQPVKEKGADKVDAATK